MEILRCNICGKILWVMKKGVVDTICCGNKMEHLIPNSVGTTEKHIPNVVINSGLVLLSVDHPSEEVHHIEWMALETNKGVYFKMLTSPFEPKAIFNIGDEKALKAYLYCNLHGLWEKEI